MIKKFLLKILTKHRIEQYIINKSIINKIKKESYKNQIHKFGNKNKNKTFYVIQREGKGGLFSILLLVLNHLLYCDKMKFIPVIDFKNFPTVYSEYNENSWEYYWEPVSKYSLDEVYKSNRVIFCNENKRTTRYFKDIKKKHLLVFKKYIKIKPYIISEAEKFLKKNKFNKKKWIGLHWGGGDKKKAPNHPFPPTKKQITNLLNRYSKNKIIFVYVEESENFNYLKKKYKNIVFIDTFRSKNPNGPHFDHKLYYGKRNYFKYTRDVFIQALIISKLDLFIGGGSNISEVIKYLFNKKIKYINIDNGINHKRLLYSFFLWKLKSLLPYTLGGFKNFK